MPRPFQSCLKNLCSALHESPFFASGVASNLRQSHLNIFFDNPSSFTPHKISLPQCSVQDMEKLIDACAPASFGRGGEDVLDPEYRKALKLDTDYFAINFCPERHGILQEIEETLDNFVSDEPRSIRAELYKLNVYAEGGFFKAHQDTPRAENMMGTLVCCLPSQFTGGQFILRKKGQEHVEDWGMKIGQDRKNEVHWIAFYSDTEHEILPIASGHRITLTYNLYFEQASKVRVETFPITQIPFYSTLESYLQDPSFLPEGGRLIYTLNHHYPWDGEILSSIRTYLKAVDYAVFRTLNLLGLSPSLKLRFSIRHNENIVTTLLTSDPDPWQYTYQVESEYDILGAFKRAGKRKGDFLYRDTEGHREDNDLWINNIQSGDDGHGDDSGSDDGDYFDESNYGLGTPWGIMQHKSTFVAYGNEASIGFAHGEFCVVGYVPSWEMREAKRKEAEEEDVNAKQAKRKRVEEKDNEVKEVEIRDCTATTD